MANPEGAINTEQIQNEEVVKNRISGFGIKVGLGGEFLTTETIPEPKVQTALTEFFAKKGENVDPTPLSKVSTEEREKATDYEPWRSWMDNWIKTAGEDTTNSSNARIAGMEALGITDVKGFATASQEKKDQQIKTLYERFFKESTKVKELADALLQSARSTDNTVSMRVLNERLQAIDSFLSSCGADSKEAITQHILMQGVAEANQATQAVFLKNAPRNINQQLKDNQPKILTDLQGKYNELHPSPLQPARPAPVPGEGENAGEGAETKAERVSIVEIGFAEKAKWEGIDGYVAVSEDNKINDSKHGLFAVLDGLGGLDAGELASQMASDEFGKSELARLPADSDVEKVKTVMKRVILDAHKKIYDNALMAQRKEKKAIYEQWKGTEEELDQRLGKPRGMATTATVVKLLEDGTAVIGSVGDTRAYVLRSSKQGDALEELTLDGGAENPEEKQRSLAIQKILSNAEKEDDLEDGHGYHFLFKHRNELNQALGLDQKKWVEPVLFIPKSNNPKDIMQELFDTKVTPEYEPMDIHPQIETTKLDVGDVLLLTSDGIHDNLTDKEIEACLKRHPNDPQGAADEILAQAYARSQDKEHFRHKEDDMTVLVIPLEKKTERGYKDAVSKIEDDVNVLIDKRRKQRQSKG